MVSKAGMSAVLQRLRVLEGETDRNYLELADDICCELRRDSITALLALVKGNIEMWESRGENRTAGELVLYIAPEAAITLWTDKRVAEINGPYALPNRLCGIRVSQDKRMYRESWVLAVLSTNEVLSKGALVEVST